MSWFSSNVEAETDNCTIPPHDNLNEALNCAEAAARLAELRRQEIELDTKLSAATDRMHEACRNVPVPPWDCDRETRLLSQQLMAHRAKIRAAEEVLRDAEGQARIARSQAARPAHGELRRRVIHALEELRDALAAEERFRNSLDFSPSILIPIRILDLDRDTLEAIIQGQKGYL
jgi:hypothetical protein